MGGEKERYERVRAVIPGGLCSGRESSSQKGCVLGGGVLPKRVANWGGGVLILRSVDEFFIKNYM